MTPRLRRRLRHRHDHHAMHASDRRAWRADRCECAVGADLRGAPRASLREVRSVAVVISAPRVERRCRRPRLRLPPGRSSGSIWGRSRLRLPPCLCIAMASAPEVTEATTRKSECFFRSAPGALPGVDPSLVLPLESMVKVQRIRARERGSAYRISRLPSPSDQDCHVTAAARFDRSG